MSIPHLLTAPKLRSTEYQLVREISTFLERSQVKVKHTPYSVFLLVPALQLQNL